MFDSIEILIVTLIQNENHILLSPSTKLSFAHTSSSILHGRLILLSSNKSCFFFLLFTFQDQEIFSVKKVEATKTR